MRINSHAGTARSEDGLFTNEKEWLTTQEAAEYLRVAVGTLRNWTSNGKIPYRKIGRVNRYKKDELRDLLNRNRRGGLYDNQI